VLFERRTAGRREPNADTATVVPVVRTSDEPSRLDWRQPRREGTPGQREVIGELGWARLVRRSRAAQLQEDLELPVLEPVGVEGVPAGLSSVAGDDRKTREDRFLDRVQPVEFLGPNLDVVVDGVTGQRARPSLCSAELVFLWIVFRITTFATMADELVASALALSRAGQCTQALRLLEVAPQTPAVRLAAASVALDSDWFTGTSLAAVRLADVAEPGWDVDFLRLRCRYRRALSDGCGPGPHFDSPFDSVDAAVGQGRSVGDDLAAVADALRDSAPDPTRRGWANMYRGLIADNVLGERSSAPAYYERALDTDDPLLTREALRHLGDHDHDRGDQALARERWEHATALGAGAGAVLGTLSPQLLLAVLARDAGDEAGATALAREIARWAGALGAKFLELQATAFLRGVDPTRPPENDAA